MTTIKPYTRDELVLAGFNGETLDAKRVMATFADPDNWAQIYNGTGTERYQARACEWAFIGGVRPPYDLAKWTLDQAGLQIGGHGEKGG